MLHDFVACASFVLCLWAILSPRVPTGIIGSAALCVIGVVSIYSLDDGHDPYVASNLLVTAGMVLALFIARKGLRTRRVHMRRRDDWNEGWGAPSQVVPSDERGGREVSHG